MASADATVADAIAEYSVHKRFPLEPVCRASGAGRQRRVRQPHVGAKGLFGNSQIAFLRSFQHCEPAVMGLTMLNK